MCSKDTDLIWILIAWNAVITAREYLSAVQQLHLFWEVCLLELPVFPLGLLFKTTYVKSSQLGMCAALDVAS